MKSKNKLLLASILAIVPALSSPAQILFTFSGTADSDALGYSED